MSPQFFTAVLPELIGLGVDLYKRFRGNHAEAVREIARIREYGTRFEESDRAARAELERLAKK